MTWHKIYEDQRTELHYCNYWHNGAGYQFTCTRIKAGPFAGNIYRARYLDKWDHLARADSLDTLMQSLKMTSQLFI
jgi:hypothetical protein